MASTGMAIVLSNLAKNLAEHGDIRIIYFGRFGWDKSGFAPEEQVQIYKGYEYVPTEGGVWNEELVRKAINIYHLDTVLSEDDWFSARGLLGACKKTKVPFHFITPIDSLPINKDALELLSRCDRVYVPNSSYKLVPNAIYLPHGVNGLVFQPLTKKQRRIFDKFTFLWIGRNEERKAMGRAILAFQKIYQETDVPCQMVIRSDWTTVNSERTSIYINHYRLPIIRDQMKNVEHGYMQSVYANCDVLLVTSKAGGFELQSVEAQASGLPVLVTDWDFMRETIVNEKSGLRIPIEGTCKDIPPLGRIWGNISIDKLSDAMLWCIQHPEAVKSMGIYGRNDVIKKYDWKIITDTLHKELIK